MIMIGLSDFLQKDAKDPEPLDASPPRVLQQAIHLLLFISLFIFELFLSYVFAIRTQRILLRKLSCLRLDQRL